MWNSMVLGFQNPMIIGIQPNDLGNTVTGGVEHSNPGYFGPSYANGLKLTLLSKPRGSVLTKRPERMSSEHQEISDFIKKVHIDLRLKARQVGTEEAWREHCKNEDTLLRYATAMRKLATEFWKKNESLGNLSRIMWVVEECEDYFLRGGRNEAMNKEKSMCARLLCDKWTEEQWRSCDTSSTRIKLLDIGSCYNPFGEFPQFDVTAIDLAPATSSVIQGDFLSMPMDQHPLVTKHYQVVVFCLLLEYLPSPSQRHLACRRAYDLLSPGGLLIIITPDSKHSSANASMIRRWRLSLAEMGFLKRSYQKSKHLHCMSYVKTPHSEVARMWLLKQKDAVNCLEENCSSVDMWVIPQDANPYSDLSWDGPSTNEREDNNSVKEAFTELPGF